MDNREICKRLYPFIRPYRGRFLQAAASMILVAGFNGAGVWLLKPVIDDVFRNRDPQMLALVVWLIPIVFFCKMVLNYTQIYLMSWIGQKATQDLRSALFRRLHDLSMDFFWRKKSAEVLSRATNDLSNVQSGLQFTPLYLIRDSLTALVLVGMLFFIQWRFALLAVLALPLCAGVLVVLGRKTRLASHKSNEVMGEIYHRFQESLQGMLVVKAFNYEAEAIARFDRENSSFWDQMMRYLRATALAGPLMEFLGALILTALIYFGGREILGGRMTPGEFFTFLAAFFAAYNPVKNLARMNAEVQRALASAVRIFQVLDETPTVVEASSPVSFRGVRECVEFRGVSFRYPDREAWALRKVDLKIRKGEVVAIAGPSGSGKTTLAHLLLRLFDPVEGEVLIDGVDLREYSSAELRRGVGLVTQDTMLLHDSVLGNVALGRPEASRDQVLAALKAADADGFVAKLPQGSDTMLGERGLKLSGGQRQRLAIARAVLKDPSLLVLDEATSNLDTASERSVQVALERLFEGRTVLMIAHRLSTLAGADRIVVMRAGGIAEEGTHQDLLKKGGVYSTLHALQRLEPA